MWIEHLMTIFCALAVLAGLSAGVGVVLGFTVYFDSVRER